MKSITIKKIITAVLICLPELLCAQSAAGPALPASSDIKIGGPAPAIKVSRWLQGVPVTEYKKGTVYVVEFWATWCGPCVDAMPHLSELSKQYAGKVVFIGANIWEKEYPNDPLNARVDKFMKLGKGKAMTYNVCQDTGDGYMDENWMKAAGQNGIPCSFVIDQNGNVAWIGNPGNELDNVIQQVLAGTYDLKQFAAEFTKKLDAGKVSTAC